MVGPATTGMSEAVWSAQATTPDAVDDALRALLKDRHAANHAFAPARVLNLVVIADREWRGEIVNRLERVGRHHPSRTVLCLVEPQRRTLDARVAVSAPEAASADAIALGTEHVELDIGPTHFEHLGTVVDPLLITDLATVLWAPHGHDLCIESLRGIGQVVLLDSVDLASVEEALERAHRLSADLHVVDLAWLRSTPWRERIAMSFDPPRLRPELGRITSVAIRHHPDSAVAGLLLVGWLSSRLGWAPGAMVRRHDSLFGRARGARQDVAVRLDPDPTLQAPGLAGITLETASALSLSLDRGPGGLHAVRRTRDGRETAWIVMGASRGEDGILGEGIREALLRDRTYGPALACARRMVG
ncbi:MAG TPA: glucose-6-phosphate dehydrogenase assembly protein OpcA [Acidimicrobiales bacterium]